MHLSPQQDYIVLMQETQERTFIAVKPDGVARKLVGSIVERFERKGWTLRAMKLVRPGRDLLARHYEEHSEKPFFTGLLDRMVEGPMVAMVWEGQGVIAGGRALIGATDPTKAAPGTIRGDYCTHMHYNAVHGSDGEEAARREIALWFQEDELVM